MATILDVRRHVSPEGESLAQFRAEWARLSDEEKAELRELVEEAS